MSFDYPKFGSNHLRAVLEVFPRRGERLMGLVADVMEPTEELSRLDRELIFAYTSYHNACHFCFESHRAVARVFGVDEEKFARIVEDPDSADLEPRLKVALRFAARLTNTPSKILESDVAQLTAEGLSEEAVMDVISVCALANYMNRFVDGLGVDITDEQASEIGPDMAADDSYRKLLMHLKVVNAGAAATKSSA
jgi:uncharacterized peroxidase-related enzyme